MNVINQRAVLLALAIYYKNDWKSIYSAIQKREILDRTLLEKADLFLENHKNIITIVDDNYPFAFKKEDEPPFVIYGGENLQKDFKKFCRNN